MQKIRKVPCIDFEWNLKNFNTKFLTKNHLNSTSFVIYIFTAILFHCNLLQKKKRNPYFWGPFGPNISKQDFFQNIWVKYNTLGCCKSTQKIKKILLVHFSNNLKREQPTFSPFGPKNPEEYFFKKSTSITFYIRWHPTFLQKIRKICKLREKLQKKG